jgi:prephenate dehydrogenase
MSVDTEKRFHVSTLAIVGVGMIGGSLSLALKQRGMVSHVIGIGRSMVNLEKALSLKTIDEISTDIADAARRADIIVLATPVGAMAKALEQITPELDATKIVTDVGSVKQGVVNQAMTIMGEKFSRFVPAHPVAGKEHSGVAAASADLYEKHKVAITPHADSDLDSCKTIEHMWRSVGADVVKMEVAEHDRVLAMTSHLPHVLAYAMVHFFAGSADKDKCYEMAAGGFYDFTRIASSDPAMWRDICRMNKSEVLEHIQGFQEKLNEIVQLLETGNGEEIEKLFSGAKKARAIVTEKRKAKQDNEAGKAGRQRVQQLVNR